MMIRLKSTKELGILKSDILPNLIRKSLICYLYENDDCRDGIVSSLNIPRTTVFDNLDKLRTFGVVDNYAKRINNKGRSMTFWKLTTLGYQIYHRIMIGFCKEEKLQKIIKLNKKMRNIKE